MTREAASDEREADSRLMDRALGERATALDDRESGLRTRENMAWQHEDAQRVVDITLAELEAHNRELRDANERLVIATVTAHELREAAQAARRQQDEFLAMLAHELRNPLAPIRTAVELLDRLDGQPIPKAVLQVIRRQVEQMVRLLDDLLDASRVTHGKVTLQRRKTAVTEFLEQALESCSDAIAEKRQGLDIDLPSVPLFIDGDPARLTQIVTNLLQNAVKYTQEGGAIAVSARQRGATVVIRVRDNGIGISPEALPHVFDLFAQDDRALGRAQGGLGVGLTVVSRMVELHGGAVEAHSGGRDQGSEFIVTLPCIEGDAEPDGALETVAIPAPASARILVVEDNIDAGAVLAQLLRLSGHDVTVALDGEAGLEQFDRTLPEVVLCDIGLPGIDGYEVAARMRTRDHVPRPSIIAITGYGGSKASGQAIEAGFDDYVIKPVNTEALLRLIAEARHRDPAD
jgi:signal transduction histidine kinase/CheY-like chemotaxis protein